MESKTIIISEADVIGNKGAVAMANCIVEGIKDEFPNTKFIITSKFIKNNNNYLKENINTLYDNEQAFDIPLIKVWLWWLLKKIGLNIKSLLNNEVLQAYSKADLIISASGISFHSNMGVRKTYHFSKYIQIPFFLDKKIIKFTQSIGPFNTYYNRMLAKLILSRINLIFARGEHSVANLKSINIEKNVKVFPDIAVLMEARKTEKAVAIIKKYCDKTIIGISPNIVCKNLDKRKNYIPSLQTLIKHILTEHSNSIILLIPHTIEKTNLGKDDDYSICNFLISGIKDKNRCEIINTLDYSPEETKWLISQCDFFIGSRFHSLIAATSTSVPSMAIGWHWKYEEMMKWFDLENNVIQYWELTEKKILKLFDLNFSYKEETKKILDRKLPEIKSKAKEAINILCEELK